VNSGSLAILILPWSETLPIDTGIAEAGGDYSGLLSKLEHLSGKLPLLAVAGHPGSRGCEDTIGAGVVEQIRQQPRAMRFMPGNLLSYDQRLNKAHSLMIFDAFAVSAVCDLPVPWPVDSLTILSDDQALIHMLSSLLGHTSFLSRLPPPLPLLPLDHTPSPSTTPSFSSSSS